MAKQQQPATEECYGRITRAALEATYVPLTLAAFVRMRQRALSGKTVRTEDVLVDDLGDGTVQLLPADATPYLWRTFWRQKRRRGGDVA